MPRQITATDGTAWTVTLSGRSTQYAKDEVSLAFTASGETRYVRFSPRGAKAPELAFEEVSDAMLRQLLLQAQPSWTSPAGDYARES
jgi:hypothetical protein